jgi:hypothetical protein
VQKPIIPSNVFNERTNIKNEIREATAIDEILKGVSMGGETTATEVKAQQNSAGRRFGLIISMLENGGYYQLAKLVFQLVQLYVTAPVMFRVIGDKGINWKEFDPNMFKGDYEPRIKLKSTLEDEKRFKMRDLKELYSAMLGNPYIDQATLTRYIIQKGFNLDPKEVETLVKTEEELMQEAQGKQEGKQAGSGEPKVIINYKDAPPDIQAQMEEESGYQASVVHEGAMESRATQQMSEQALNGEQIAPVPTTPPQPMQGMQGMQGMSGAQGGEMPQGGQGGE